MLNRVAARLSATLAAMALVVLPTGCISTGGVVDQSVASASGLVRSVTSGTLPSGLSSASTTETQATAQADLTPAERRMREQSRAFQKTVWQGALIGAGAGAALGLIRGDDTKGVLTKAAIGGAVGGLAGVYVAHKQRQYSDKEDQLESMIVDVRKSNTETEQLIASARQVIAEDKRRLAAVEQRYRSGKATEAELAQTRQRIADNQAVIAQASTGAREQYQMFQGAEREFRQKNPGTDTATLKRELDNYNQRIETLDGLTETVAVA